MFARLLLLPAVLASQAPTATLEIPSAVIKLAEEVDVPALTAGVIQRVEVREGQVVPAGQELVRLLDDDIQLDVDRAALELEIATKRAENEVNVRFAAKSAEVARAELQRSLDSVEKFSKSVSDTELDRLRLVVERSELEVKQAEHEQQIAQTTLRIKEIEHRAAVVELQRRRLLTPLAGMVVEVHRRPGEWVEPGETVVRILRLDRLRAEGYAAAGRASAALVGSRLRLRLEPDDGGGEIEGEVVFVSPEIDPIDARVRLWAEFDNAAMRLRPGMRGTLILPLPLPPRGGDDR